MLCPAVSGPVSESIICEVEEKEQSLKHLYREVLAGNKKIYIDAIALGT